jgi:hypothetical protein
VSRTVQFQGNKISQGNQHGFERRKNSKRIEFLTFGDRMADTIVLPDPPLSVPVRDQFAPLKAAFLVAIHLGAIAAFWHTN